MKEGMILIMDEINMNYTEVLAILNSPLDKSRTLFYPPTNETIKADDYFICIGTMNQNYAGTRELNKALVNRMMSLKFKPINSMGDIIKKINPQISNKVIEQIDKIHKKIIKIESSKKYLTSEELYSVRAYEELALMLENGIELDSAFETAILNKLEDEEDRNLISNTINIC